MGISIPNLGSGAIGDPIGKVVVEILADDKAYKEGLRKSEKALDLFDKKTQRIAKRAGKAFLAGGIAISAALAGVVFHAARAGDELDKMSLRTGETVENLSRLSFAADISGTSLQAVETGIRRLSRNMNDFRDGTGEAAESFERLGIDVVNTEGELRTNLDVLTEIADKLNELGSEAEKTAIAQELFGRSGANLLPLLKQGSAGIQALMDRADELGIVMTTAGATISAEFSDSVTELTTVVKMGAVQLGQTLLPAIQNIIEKITDLTARFNKLTENQKKIIGWTTAIGGGFSLIAGGALLIVAKLPALIAGFAALAAFPAVLPITLAIVALGGAIAIATVEWRRFNKELERMKVGAQLKLIATEAGEAGEQLRDAMFGAREETDEFRLGVGDLSTGLDKLNAITDAVGIKTLVLDSRFAEIKATLGDTGGFISVTDAATAALKAFGDTTDKLNVTKFVKLGEGVEGIEELLAALSGDTITIKGIEAQRARLEAWARAAGAVRDVINETIGDVGVANQAALRTEFMQLGGFISDPDVPAGRRTVAVDFGMTSPEQLKARRLEMDAEVEALKRRIMDRQKALAIADKANQERNKASARALTEQLDLTAAQNKRTEILYIKDAQAAIKATEKSADERAKIAGDYFALVERGAKNVRKEEEQAALDVTTAQEQAAADVLRAWERTKDDIQFAFVGLFDSIIREGKADWQTFLDDLGRMFSKKFAEIAADATIGKLLDKLAGVERGDSTDGTFKKAVEKKVTGTFLDKIGEKIFGAGTEAQLPGGGTLGEKIFGAAAGTGAAAVAPAGTGTAATVGAGASGSALVAAASVVLPVVVAAGIIAGGVKTIQSFLRHRDIQQRIESGDIIPIRRGARAGVRRSESPDRETATKKRSRLEALGEDLRGDNFVRIDNLVIQMPEDSRSMSRAELDQATSRQVGSIARAFRRSPRDRRSFMR